MKRLLFVAIMVVTALQLAFDPNLHTEVVALGDILSRNMVSGKIDNDLKPYIV